MTKGRQIPINSKVRRRLFSEDEPTPPKSHLKWEGEDYLSRVIKTEYIARNLNNELIFQGMKWNFDFQKQLPVDGPTEWYLEKRSGQWIGIQPTGKAIHMTDRSKDPKNAFKSSYFDSRSKLRRLTSHVVAKRRSFFDDARTVANAKTQTKDENYVNLMLERNQHKPPMSQEEFLNTIVPWNFDFDAKKPLKGYFNWVKAGEDWVGNAPDLDVDTRVIIFTDYLQAAINNVFGRTEDAIEPEEDDNDELSQVLGNITQRVRVVYENSDRLKSRQNGSLDEADYVTDEYEKLRLSPTETRRVHVFPRATVKNIIRRKNKNRIVSLAENKTNTTA